MKKFWWGMFFGLLIGIGGYFAIFKWGFQDKIKMIVQKSVCEKQTKNTNQEKAPATVQDEK